MPSFLNRPVAGLSRHSVLKLAAVAALALTGAAHLPSMAQDAAPAAPARYPEPSLYPLSWELKFTHATPKRIVVQSSGDSTPRAYWYMTYSVTNEGDESVDFDPVFELFSEDGKTHRANRAIPNEVFEAIKKKEGNKLLESPRKVVGIVKPGTEQARDSVAIWPEPNREMGTFSIFVAGLSGETLTLKKVGDEYVPINPKNAAEELKDVKEEDRLQLKKQFQVTYRVLGDDDQPGIDPIEKRASKWVMR